MVEELNPIQRVKAKRRRLVYGVNLPLITWLIIWTSDPRSVGIPMILTTLRTARRGMEIKYIGDIFFD